MNISCEVIRDVLPLYVENLASPQTRELVEAHIADCEGCREALAQLSAPQAVPRETDTDGLNRIRKGIRRRRGLTALLALLLTSGVLVWLVLFLTNPTYLPARAVTSVKRLDDGRVAVTFDESVDGYSLEKGTNPDDGTYVTVLAWKSLRGFFAASLTPADTDLAWYGSSVGEWDGNTLFEGFFFGNQKSTVFLPADVDRVWYSSTREGEEDTLLFGEPYHGGRISLYRYVLGAYCGMAAIAGGLLAVLAFLLRKKKLGVVAGCAAGLCGCFVLSSLAVTGGSFGTHHTTELFCGICVLTLLLWGALLTGMQLYRMRKKDKML